MPPGGGGSAQHVVNACEESRVSLVANSIYLVFDHFHADLQAFSTDVADNLILVSEFCQFRHEIGAHVKTDLLRAILFDGLLSTN